MNSGKRSGDNAEVPRDDGDNSAAAPLCSFTQRGVFHEIFSSTRIQSSVAVPRGAGFYVTPSLYITPYLRAEVFADYSFSSVKKAPASAVNERCVPLTKSHRRFLARVSISRRREYRLALRNALLDVAAKIRIRWPSKRQSLQSPGLEFAPRRQSTSLMSIARIRD